ncbi:MAG TPA: thiolase family protein [archaeon]|nr:thiolase family protein [archaeon]
MRDVFIVDAARSPIGKFLGSLSGYSATQIGAEVVKALLKRTKVKSPDVNELITGNVISAGLGQNPAKQVVRYSGMPDEIPTTNVNKVCASGLEAIDNGFLKIASGRADVIIAGGVESMSNAPYSVKGRDVHKIGNISLNDFVEKLKQAGKDLTKMEVVDEMVNAGLWDCYVNLHMGTLAEKIGEKYKISRQEQDKFAVESHRKAADAIDKGKFKKEIVPIKLPDGRIFEVDEGVRKDSSLEKLAGLKPAFRPDGTITAANASQLSDGASFVVLMSEQKMKEYGLRPLAKIEGYAASGNDPTWYGLAPTPAIRKVLETTNHTLNQIDLIELNEAFCVQALGVVKELGIDVSKLNVNGGATALGHPIGATGARILTTLIYAMHDRNKKLGLAALCHGGGGAAAMVISKI